MRRLLLIKHARPMIDPRLPAAEWRLAPDSHNACMQLAERLRGYRPEMIFSSVEPKAQDTSAAIAAQLGIGWEKAIGLHEHDRTHEPFTNEAGFQKAIEALFALPDQVVYGSESADQALQRFGAALEQILVKNSAETLAVVAHGTVISLWVAQRTGTPAYSIWQRLGLPSCIVMDLDGGEILEIIEGLD